MRIAVTDHAWKRWRQRMPGAGNDTKDDVVAAFKLARKVQKGDPVPLVRRDGDGALLYTNGEGFFVVRQDFGSDEQVILTFKRSWIMDLHAESEASKQTSPVTVNSDSEMPATKKPVDERVFEDPLPTFSEVNKEHQWLMMQISRLFAAMAKMRRDHPLRQKCVDALNRIGNRKAAMARKKAETRAAESRDKVIKKMSANLRSEEP